MKCDPDEELSKDLKLKKIVKWNYIKVRNRIFMNLLIIILTEIELMNELKMQQY